MENGLTRRGTEREKSGEQDFARGLDLGALRQTPGFMVRILQLQNFEAFYRHFETLEMSPVEYSILVTVVILSAFVPTLIAQQLYRPDLEEHRAASRAAAAASGRAAE